MRILIYYKNGAYRGEVVEEELISARQYEEINGEHSLTLTTTQMLEKGWRLLFKSYNNRGNIKWFEYVVAGIDEEHHIGDTVIRTYYCIWSLQNDLSVVLVSAMPGVRTPVSSRTALSSLLSSQTRWAVGTVSGSKMSGASMYDRSAWDALSVYVENWGGEIDADIAVDLYSGVTTRKVCSYEIIGANMEPQARLDFGANVSSITRSQTDEPLYCRIAPRGKGEQSENGGYGRKIKIGDMTYQPMVNAAYIKNPDGTFIYPTLKVENSKCETVEELSAWAESVLEDYCTPNFIYKVDVHHAITIDNADSDLSRLQLGDWVQVVDHSFGDESIQLDSRVISIDRDLLNDKNSILQIGSSKQSISSKFSSLGGSGGTNYSNPSVSSAIGGVEPATTASIDVPSSTLTNICSVSLPPGVWVVTGQITFGQNGTGRRVIKLSTTSQDSANVPSQTMQLAVSDVGTRMSTTRCFSLATQTTVYLIGNQGSGTTLTCSGLIEATKVG